MVLSCLFRWDFYCVGFSLYYLVPLREREEIIRMRDGLVGSCLFSLWELIVVALFWFVVINEDEKFKPGLVKFRTVADRRKRFTEEVHISLIDYIMNGSYYFGCELNLCPLFVPYGIVNQQPPAKLLDVFYFCDTTFLFFKYLPHKNTQNAFAILTKKNGFTKNSCIWQQVQFRCRCLN